MARIAIREQALLPTKDWTPPMAIAVHLGEKSATTPEVMRLSARSGCSRPIFDPDLAEFRAEPVRTTLGTALRRRPRLAPRARALCPLRNYLPTGPSLSQSFTSSNTQRSGPQARRLALATEIGAYRGRRNIIDQFHPNWKPEKVLPSPESRVTITSGGSRATSFACVGKALGTEIRRNDGK